MEGEDLKIDLKYWFDTVLKFSLKRVEMSDKFEKAKQEIREKYQGRIKEKDLRKYVYLTSYGKELEEWEIEQMKFELYFMFLPNEDELFMINLKRENKFDELKENYLFKLGLCVLGENVLIDKVIKQKQYIYLNYYYDDSLISLSKGFDRNLSINERCDTIIENLSSDLALYDFVQYLEGRKTEELNDNINEGKIIDVTLDIQSNKPSVKSFALYYYFLIESGVEKPFDIAPNGKIKAMEEISKLFKISAGQFRKEYDSINRSNRDRMLYEKNRDKNYLNAIELLKKCPEKNMKAVMMAEEEYKNLPVK